MSHTRSVRDLINHLESGAAVNYCLFYGHTANKDGSVDMNCFSQWFPAAFDVDGTTYKTAEQYMMAAKAAVFGDDEMLAEIMKAKSPGAAKELGRKVRGFDDIIWNREREACVIKGNLAKFKQNEAMKTALMKTGSAVLVEASPRDRIWGIGLGRSNEFAREPSKWKGLNLLGFALMDVRFTLSESKTD